MMRIVCTNLSFQLLSLMARAILLLVIGGILVAAVQPAGTKLGSNTASNARETHLSAAHQAAAASWRVGPPQWLQIPTEAPQAAAAARTAQASAQMTPPGRRLAPQYIMLQRSTPVRHTLAFSPGSGKSVKIKSLDLRAGVVHNAIFNASGDHSIIRVQVTDNNEYLAVGVFAKDLPAGADVDMSLSFQGELMTETANPAGIDEFLEARDGVMPGEYVVNVTGSSVPADGLTAQVYVWVINEDKPGDTQAKVSAVSRTALQITPNPVTLTAAPGCCSFELSVNVREERSKPASR